jgi:hypothetical protein
VADVDVDWREVYDWAGLQIRQLITMHHDPAETALLDVGAGQGKYARLLPEYRDIDAIEIWEPSVERYGLNKLYRVVWACHVLELVSNPFWQVRPERYRFAILGDVLEHLESGAATKTLRYLLRRCDELLVVVPYLYPQGAEDGNEHQRHLQDDLTPEVMAVRYPDLKLIALETRDGRPFKGLYRE